MPIKELDLEKRLGVLEGYMAVCTEGNYLRSEVFFLGNYHQQFSRRSLQVFYTKDEVKHVMSNHSWPFFVPVDGYSSGKRLL